MFLCRCRRPKVRGMGFLKLISQAFPRPLPQSPLVFFPTLSLALFFARAPLSERLEQAIIVYDISFLTFPVIFSVICYCFIISIDCLVPRRLNCVGKMQKERKTRVSSSHNGTWKGLAPCLRSVNLALDAKSARTRLGTRQLN